MAVCASQLFSTPCTEPSRELRCRRMLWVATPACAKNAQGCFFAGLCVFGYVELPYVVVGQGGPAELMRCWSDASGSLACSQGKRVSQVQERSGRQQLHVGNANKLAWHARCQRGRGKYPAPHILRVGLHG